MLYRATTSMRLRYIDPHAGYPQSCEIDRGSYMIHVPTLSKTRAFFLVGSKIVYAAGWNVGSLSEAGYIGQV